MVFMSQFHSIKHRVNAWQPNAEGLKEDNAMGFLAEFLPYAASIPTSVPISRIHAWFCSGSLVWPLMVVLKANGGV